MRSEEHQSFGLSPPTPPRAPVSYCELCSFFHAGCPQKVPGGAQEQRGESGEVPGGAEEAAQEEPGQQEPVQVRRKGDAGEGSRRRRQRLILFSFWFCVNFSEPHLIIQVDAWKMFACLTARQVDFQSVGEAVLDVLMIWRSHTRTHAHTPQFLNVHSHGICNIHLDFREVSYDTMPFALWTNKESSEYSRLVLLFRKLNSSLIVYQTCNVKNSDWPL